MRYFRTSIGTAVLTLLMAVPYIGVAQEKPNKREEFIGLVDKYANALLQPYDTSKGTVAIRSVPEKGNRFDIDLKSGGETLTASETLESPKRFVFVKERKFTPEERKKNGLTVINGYRYMRIDEVKSGIGGCLYAGLPEPKTNPRPPEYDKVEAFAGRDCEYGFWEDLARFTETIKEYEAKQKG